MIKTLISEKRLKQRVRTLAKKISRDYRGKPLVLVGVLKGSFVFLADLVREIKIPLALDFIQVSSYGASTYSSRVIKIKKDLDLPVVGKHLLIIEDIIDYGYTLDYLLKFLAHKKAASVQVCVLLDKPSRRKVKVPVAYRGFKVADRFIVGYGLDQAEMHRNLKAISYLQK